jgi:hypothetical protein
LLKITHYFQGFRGPTNDVVEFFSLVKANQLPKLHCVTIGERSSWDTDLSVLNAHPQIKIIHFQSFEKENEKEFNLSHVKCVILSSFGHVRKMFRGPPGQPRPIPTIDLSQGYLNHFPNLIDFYTNHTIQNQNYAPPCVQVHQLKSWELYDIYEKTY